MSGYLQRLVSGALTRTTAIQPVLESRFSASTRDADVGSLETFKERAIHPTSDPPVVNFPGSMPSDDPAVREPGRLPLTDDEKQEPVEDGDSATLESRARASEFLSQTQAEGELHLTAIASARAGVTSAVEDPQLVSQGQSLRAQSDIQPRPREKQTTRQRPYAPLMTEKTVATESEGRSDSARWDSRTNGERTTPTRPITPQAHETGDIQIHIGRIEVTALPPAPSRSEQPVRKSIKLEEYLKRGRGSSG